MYSPEQYELNFGEDKKGNPSARGSSPLRRGEGPPPATKAPKTPEVGAIKIEVHPNDECQACGNRFESAESCFQCRGNKAKISWRIKNQNQKKH